jgi:uncharacterized protein YoaH (UPF0181 family)
LTKKSTPFQSLIPLKASKPTTTFLIPEKYAFSSEPPSKELSVLYSSAFENFNILVNVVISSKSKIAIVAKNLRLLTSKTKIIIKRSGRES